jgi:hypothetical protein
VVGEADLVDHLLVRIHGSDSSSSPCLCGARVVGGLDGIAWGLVSCCRLLELLGLVELLELLGLVESLEVL